MLTELELFMQVGQVGILVPGTLPELLIPIITLMLPVLHLFTELRQL